MIVGVVLAAGESRRMGRPKALLDAGGEAFFERAVRALKDGGCQEVVIVVDPADPDLAERIASAGLRTALGEGIGGEQIDSLRAGLRAIKATAKAAIVLPVDHPRVDPATVAALIDAFREHSAPVVLPVFEGKRGHPVLFSATVFDELLHGRPSEGARSVVHDHANDLEEVAVDDRGVLIDIDTPRDYEEHLGEAS